MRSKGSRFALGVWGLRVCSFDVAEPFATVRNRPREGHMAVSMVSSAEGSFLEVSNVSLLRFAWHAWHFVTFRRFFVTCRKSFYVAGAILLQRFQKMRCSFRGRRSTLDVSIVIWRGRGNTLDVSCCVFVCELHWQGCVRWRQGANCVVGVAFCAIWWKLTEASHETLILR